jgi:plasmid stability protein
MFFFTSSIIEEYWRHSMATLNIKNFPDAVYKKLRERAKREHRSVSGEVVHLLSEAVEPPQLGSILDLRGLGKEIWGDVETASHVDKERRSWD